MATAPRTPEQNVTASEAMTELTKQRMSLHAALKADAIYQLIPVSNRSVFCAYDRLVRALSGATQITKELAPDCKVVADWLMGSEQPSYELACELHSFVETWVQTCQDIVEGRIGKTGKTFQEIAEGTIGQPPHKPVGYDPNLQLLSGEVRRIQPLAADSIAKIIVNAAAPTIEYPVVRACAMRWAKGRETRGPAFEGDPIPELYEELIDSINYCDEAEVQGDSFAEEREILWNLAHRVREKYLRSLDEEVDLCGTESHIVDVVANDVRNGGRIRQEIRKVTS